MPAPSLRFFLLAALAFLAGSPATAQVREVVSSQVAVSGGNAALTLTFQDDSTLEIRLRDGAVLVDGDEIGAYEPGGGLERSWRGLLGEVVALDGDPLTEALASWSPPADLDGDDPAVARTLDETLEEALTAAAPQTDPDPEVTVSGDLDISLLTSLVGRTQRFIALAEAMDELDLDLDDMEGSDVHLHLGEDVSVPAGETLTANLVLIDSDLDVQGTLDGNAILLGGSLRVGEDAVIDGEVHVSEARVLRDGGVVEGGINRLRLEREVVDSQRFDELRDEIREELRREIRASVPDGRHDTGPHMFSRAARSVSRSVGGMMENLFSFAILAVLAFLVVRFYRPNLEVVAEVARENPTRAGVVGIAGAFLLLPVWILGIVGLCISLIGIPVLLAWIPLFPIAALLAAGLGFLAVANNVGEWVVRQRLQGFSWVREGNVLSVVLAGVAALILPFFAANFMILAGGWLGWVRGLITFAGTVAAVIAFAVGFGAVLLTRGGRRSDWAFADEDLDLDREVWDEEFRQTEGADTETAEASDGDTPAPAGEATAPADETPAEEPRAEGGPASDARDEPADSPDMGPRTSTDG